MENKKEKTAPDVSVGADTEQPISKKLQVVYPRIVEISGVLRNCREKCSCDQPRPISTQSP